jgi:hypothetical protein
MKRFILLGFVGLALAAGGLVHGQQVQPATAVQHTSTRLDAGTHIDTSVTSAATITLTPNAGESVYVEEVDAHNCAGASAVTAAVPTTITTTNLVGSPAYTLGSGSSAGLCTQTLVVQYPFLLKAQTTGTAVTFVMPTFATNQTVRLNVAWRSAP